MYINKLMGPSGLVLHAACSGHEHCFCHLPAGTPQETVYKASRPYLLKLEKEKLAGALVQILLMDGISIFFNWLIVGCINKPSCHAIIPCATVFLPQGFLNIAFDNSKWTQSVSVLGLAIDHSEIMIMKHH